MNGVREQYECLVVENKKLKKEKEEIEEMVGRMLRVVKDRQSQVEGFYAS